MKQFFALVLLNLQAAANIYLFSAVFKCRARSIDWMLRPCKSRIDYGTLATGLEFVIRSALNALAAAVNRLTTSALLS